MQDYGPLAKNLEERYGTLKSARSPWESLWQEIAQYVMPRRVAGMAGTIQGPGTLNETLLFDTTAVRANMTLANGQLAWMSPLESAWFAFEPQPFQDSDDARRWLVQATDIARDQLAVSNFYVAVHEFYLDRGAFGTACLYIEPGKKNLINAQIWPVGSFVIDEDDNGIVDTVIREFKLTARQAIQKFGEDNVSAKIKDAVANGGAKAHERHTFLHAIYPRDDAERDATKLDSPNMPIASVYIEKDGCSICQVGGYEEMPVMVSRYLEWGSGMGGLYGWSPAFAALPEARQLNFLQKMLDALAEKMAFPPVLAPDDLEGEIDANAMGVTYFSRDLAAANAMPKEWMTQGRYDIGVQRVQERQKAINDAFHVDLFQMFAQIQKQMTATEVQERAQEKLIQFSPTFARLTTELFNPLLERVFSILLRMGKLGPIQNIPQKLIRPIGKGKGYIAPPAMQYASRIALALRALPSLAYQRTLQRLAATVTLSQSVVDNFDFDVAERQTSLGDGMPPEFIKPMAVVNQARQARAQAQQQAQQQAQAAQAAEAAGKLGQIKQGSPMAQALQNQNIQSALQSQFPASQPSAPNAAQLPNAA